MLGGVRDVALFIIVWTDPIKKKYKARHVKKCKKCKVWLLILMWFNGSSDRGQTRDFYFKY